MRKTTINKLRMFQTVLEVLKQHQQVWQANTGLTELLNEIEATLTAIETAMAQAGVNTVGLTSDKNSLVNELSDLMMEISGPFTAIARRINNNDLLNKVQFTDSELEHLTDLELSKKAAAMALLALQYADMLAKYEITAADITQLQTDAELLAKKINEPRTAVAGRVAANARLTQLLATTNVLLKDQMDGVVNRYRRNNPDFWSAYFAARKTIEYGTRHVKKTENSNTTTTN